MTEPSLLAMAVGWAAEPDKVAKNVAALRAALADLAKPSAGGAIDIEVINNVANRLLAEIDTALACAGAALRPAARRGL